MFPYPRAHPFNVILFTSIIGIEPSPFEKIIKMNYILRGLLSARVSNLFLIDDVYDKNLLKFIDEVIKYSLLPPYLKRTIPKKRELKFAGLLEPMNFYYHIVHPFPVEGEIRMIKVTGKNRIETGLKEEVNINDESSKQRYIIITDSLSKRARMYDLQIYYTGFKWRFITFKKLNAFKNLIIGSRSGKDPFSEREEILKLYRSMGITLLIGPPKMGVIERLGEKFLSRAYNFFPKQGVKDIRAEEALLYSLGILLEIIDSKGHNCELHL